MGYFDDFIDGVVGIQPLKQHLVRRKEAMHRAQSGGLRQDVETLISRLDELDTVLQGAEYTAQTDYAEKIADIRGKLGEVKEVISKPLNYYNALDEIWAFVNDVKNTARFTPGQDPLGEAKAYGKAMKSLGKLAGRIPLLNIYASFLEEMGGVFAQTVESLVPHLRGNVRRADERIMPILGRSVFD